MVTSLEPNLCTRHSHHLTGMVCHAHASTTLETQCKTKSVLEPCSAQHFGNDTRTRPCIRSCQHVLVATCS